MNEMRSRRDEYSDASRRAILDSARARFTSEGYVATSLDAVAADARMTKGAVYHHFASKQAVFEAVLDELERETVAAVAVASGQKPTAWESALAGLDMFLERCLDPSYQRLCFQEGPIALGHACWYQRGEEHEVGLLKAMGAGLKAEGLIDVDDLETLTQLLFGAMCACALAIARSDDPLDTRDRMRAVLVRMVLGLRPPKRGRS